MGALEKEAKSAALPRAAQDAAAIRQSSPGWRAGAHACRGRLTDNTAPPGKSSRHAGVETQMEQRTRTGTGAGLPPARIARFGQPCAQARWRGPRALEPGEWHAPAHSP